MLATLPLPTGVTAEAVRGEYEAFKLAGARRWCADQALISAARGLAVTLVMACWAIGLYLTPLSLPGTVAMTFTPLAMGYVLYELSDLVVYQAGTRIRRAVTVVPLSGAMVTTALIPWLRTDGGGCCRWARSSAWTRSSRWTKASGVRRCSSGWAGRCSPCC